MLDGFEELPSHFFTHSHGHRQHFIDVGAGPPVVMVHGNPTWSFFYRRLIGRLKDRFRVIVPDHIGCGRSDKPTDQQYSFRLSQRVDDLTALLDHLRLTEPIRLIVHDWGGMIGLSHATRHLEQIDRVVVMNTAGFRLPTTKPLPLSLRLCRLPMIGPLLVQGLNGFCRGALQHCSVRRLPPDVRQYYLAPYDSWAHRLAVLRFVQDIPLDPSHPSYATVLETETNLGKLAAKPMVICWGQRDFVFDDHFLADWRRRFPDVPVHLFPNAGHYLLEDVPDDVGAIVDGFFR